MKENVSIENEQWTTVILPHNRWMSVPVSELWQYRDLIGLFVRRDFVSKYKQTVLGPLWFFIKPLFTTIVFTVIFGRLAKISTDGLPPLLFYMSGTVVWNYFATCLNNSSNTLRGSSGIFGKVYFPRLAVPVSQVISNLFQFGLQLLFFICFMLYFLWKGTSIEINAWLLFFPLLLLQMAALGLGVGVIISSLTAKYRDMSYLMGFATPLWMYATPVVYPLSIVPERWKWLAALNPMTPVVEIFRYGFLGAGDVSILQWGISFAITLALLFFGAIIFNRVEKNFIDTV